MRKPYRWFLQLSLPGDSVSTIRVRLENVYHGLKDDNCFVRQQYRSGHTYWTNIV